uniref:Synaptobrevin, longin-like domain protein n=1 Tax=Tanacetum cinerariifolium TaxID=118510 RepID=A0A699HBC9_TANCI|nr:hypothetical protein [Tanacetum cinerariifolium]
MNDYLSIDENDKVNHIVVTDMMKLVVEVECFERSFDDVDKGTGSSDGLQPKQANLSCVHALNEPHLHEIHVIPRAEDGSFIMTPFKVSALNVDFDLKIDLIVFGLEIASAMSTLTSTISLSSDDTSSSSHSLALAMIHLFLTVTALKAKALELRRASLAFTLLYLASKSLVGLSSGIPTASDEFPLPEYFPTASEGEFPLLRIETTDAETKILVTVDGKPITISELSIRRNLKLHDEARISSLPNVELFENLTLMGYNISPNQNFTFQKGQFSHQWKYLIHNIMQCLSLKSTGFNEFSSNIATAVVCLATNRVYNFSKMIFDGMVRNVNNKGSNFLMYPRFISKCLKMSQFGQITHSHTYTVPFHTMKIFTTLRVNSPSFSGRTVPLFPTMLVTTSEGSGTPTEPHHTPTPEVQQSPPTAHSSPSLPPVTTELIPTVIPTETPSPLRQYTMRARIAQSSALPTAADEPASPLGDDSQGEAFPTTEIASKITAQELKITSLKARVKLLEDKDGEGAEPSREDATIKRRSLETGKEAVVKKSTERGSNDTEELVNVLTSLDAASILTSGVQMVSVPSAAEVATISVPTGSGMVPTASPIFTTASVVTPYSRQKAREIEEQIAKEDQRMNEQIARDAEIARIHTEEDLQMLIDGLDRNNETIAKYLQEYE